MKAGAENRAKTIALGVLGAGALCGVLYNVVDLFSGGSSTPPPAVAPLTSTPAPVRPSTASETTASTERNLPGGAGAIPGVPAQRIASNASSLDPTLDQAAMLRTESLVYSGSGRNIFSATYVLPPPPVPTGIPSARPSLQPGPRGPMPPLMPSGPPPIPLRFFGTAQRAGGAKQAFLLSGDDVYLAAPGEIVAKRYRVGAISAYGVQITDLGSNNTQTLPLLQQ